MKKKEGESEDVVRVKKTDTGMWWGGGGQKEHRHVVVVSSGWKTPLGE